MQNSKIEWTDVTENPIKVKAGGNYCEKISRGCAYCYASLLNSRGTRFGGNGLAFGGGPQEAPEMTLNIKMIEKWVRMRVPKKHFVGSMTDIFGDWVESVMIYMLLDAMARAPKQTFQLLTKRPENMAHQTAVWFYQQAMVMFPKNIWLGTSAEDQTRLDERIPWLIRSQASVRFLSLEPLLGPISLPDNGNCGANWIIIGGESGSHARPMDIEWVRDILEQCQAAGVPAFVKQLGQRWSGKNGAVHRKGGEPDEWPADLRVRMMPGETW